MKEDQKLPKRILLIILVALTLPAFQGLTHLIFESPLHGFATESIDPTFSTDSWFSGEYQELKDKKVAETFGLRNSAIRIHNQLLYSLFNKSKVHNVVIGKESYLYEEDYIKSYYGIDFIGEDSIQRRMQELKLICDSLETRNKMVLVVFTSGKGFYYPEYVPENRKANKSTTNLERYVYYAKKYGIHYIDFNDYFLKQKQKYGHLLYPQHGIHWSVLASDIAADSITRYIEAEKGIDLPNIYWNEHEIYKAPDVEHEIDYDIANSMNLLFKFPSKQMAYHKLYHESDSGKVKPSLLVIGDSFYWPICDLMNTSFSDQRFWYYNRQIHPGNNLTVDMINTQEELLSKDIVVIIATPSNLPAFSWGFIENTYRTFTKKAWGFDRYWKKVEEYRQFINSDKEWLEGARRRAVEKNIPLDSSVTLDAIYQTKREMELDRAQE